MHRKLRRGGFTLIEVLVAIGIAAIGLAAVLAVVTNSAGNAMSQRTRTLASWVAFNRLTLTRLGSTLPATELTKGDVDFANLKWKWEQNVTATDVPNILRIDVKVRLSDDPDDATRATVLGFAGRAQMSSPPLTTPWDQSASGTTAGAPTANGTSATGQTGGQTGGTTPGQTAPTPTIPPTTTTTSPTPNPATTPTASQ